MSKGLSNDDIESFNKGLKAMSLILSDLPHLMLTWDNISTIFTSRIISLKTLW